MRRNQLMEPMTTSTYGCTQKPHSHVSIQSRCNHGLRNFPRQGYEEVAPR